MEGFAHCAAPLHRLVGVLQQGRKKPQSQALQDHWDPTCETAFHKLKQKLVRAPVLGYADFSKPFILEIDASHAGLEAVLSQDQGGGEKTYASRGLHAAERNMSNYSSMKLELLALKWSISEKFREYLLGNKFTVYTDNNPLKLFTESKIRGSRTTVGFPVSSLILRLNTALGLPTRTQMRSPTYLSLSHFPHGSF